MLYKRNPVIMELIQSFHRNLFIDGLPVFKLRLKHMSRKENKCLGQAPYGKIKTIDSNGSVILVDNLEELKKKELIRSWRTEGLKLEEIQAKCIENDIRTRSGEYPNLSTLSRWTKGCILKKPIVIKIPDFSKKRGPKPLVDKEENNGLRSLIYNLRKQGKSYRYIVEQAENAGYTNSKGKPFARTQIVRIHQNTIKLLRHKEGFKL